MRLRQKYGLRFILYIALYVKTFYFKTPIDIVSPNITKIMNQFTFKWFSNIEYNDKDVFERKKTTVTKNYQVNLQVINIRIR